MKDILKMIRLDLIAIRPYVTVKNFVILLIVTACYFIFGNNAAVVFSIPLLFAILFASYPFLVGDQSGLDVLYRLFSIQPATVVKGRYLLSILLFVSAILTGLLFYGVTLSISLQKNRESLLEYLFVYLIIYSLIIAFQYPLYFKYGYAKAKTLSFIPFLALGLLTVVSAYFSKYLKQLFLLMVSNNVVSSLIIITIPIILLWISFNLSCKWYVERDL